MESNVLENFKWAKYFHKTLKNMFSKISPWRQNTVLNFWDPPPTHRW